MQGHGQPRKFIATQGVYNSFSAAEFISNEGSINCPEKITRYRYTYTIRLLSQFQPCYCNLTYYQEPLIYMMYIWTKLTLLSTNLDALGPLPHTVTDFWRLVWQERCSLVVMLCNVKESNRVRCQQYWPSDRPVCFGPFSVALSAAVQKKTDYVIRTMEVTVGSPKNVFVCMLSMQLSILRI